MAVMTTSSPSLEKLSLEHQKAQTAPASDLMALDQDVNGSLDRPDPAKEPASHSVAAPEPVPHLNSADDAPHPQTNGGMQHSSSSVATPAVNDSADAETAQAPPDAPPATLPEPLLDSAENLAATTTVPPRIDPPVSDVREEIPSASVSQPPRPEETVADAAPPVQEGVAESATGMDDTTEATNAPVHQEEVNADRMDTSEDVNLPHRMAAEVQPALPEEVTDQPKQEVPPVSQPSSGSQDQEMQEAPLSAKLARGRDEDEDDGDGIPSAKRVRTDDEEVAQSEFKVPEVPAAAGGDSAVENGTAAAAAPAPAAGTASQTPQRPYAVHARPTFEDTPMTKAQQRFLLDRLRNTKKIKAAQAFLHPVDAQSLNIPTYYDVIKNPMDMNTLEGKLRQDQYPTINAFLTDFDLIVQNSITFNGPDHAVSLNGLNMKAYFNKGLVEMPRADADESASAPKKQKRPTISTSTAQKPSRRESRASAAPAPSPAATAGSPQSTYALQPDGLPLIRRDSNVGDGRPKREIHRPPPRDLPYSAKPKKKKYQLELKFCETVVSEMNKKKYYVFSYPFMQPVDPVALNIPTYHKVIKKPMDFGTVTNKLKNGHYENAKEFHADVKLMFDNCFKFNPEKDGVHQMGKSFQQLFEELWSKKDEWVAEHAPPSGPQSPGAADSEDDDDDGVDDEEEERQAKLLEIQQQIFMLSAEAQKMFSQVPKRTSPKAGGSGAKRSSGGAKGSTKSAAGKSSKKGSGSISGPSASSAKASSGKSKAKAKLAPITHAQKQEIADAISGLQGEDMMNAIQIIRAGVPQMKGGEDEEELELEIEQIPDNVLHELLRFIRKLRPQQPSGDEDYEPDSRNRGGRTGSTAKRSAPGASAATTKSRKNKPMNKFEQEQQIQHIRDQLREFQNPGSSADQSPEPAKRAESSSDDESASESEEE